LPINYFPGQHELCEIKLNLFADCLANLRWLRVSAASISSLCGPEAAREWRRHCRAAHMHRYGVRLYGTDPE
jgi:hypothetical protein